MRLRAPLLLLALAPGCSFVIDGVEPRGGGSDGAGGSTDLARMPGSEGGTMEDLAMPDLQMPDLQMPDLQMPDLAPLPTCNDGKKNGGETDNDCGGGCPACGIGKGCKVDADCLEAICDGGTCRNAVSCLEILNAHGGLGDGTYTIDPDKGGGTAGFKVFCDMSTDGKGWTLVVNQVPGDVLPDLTGDVKPANFGNAGLTFRVGSPTITTIVPTVAWKLTDATNAVYIKPACKVDWNNDFTNVGTPGICTTGYRAADFAQLYTLACYPAWVRGIGINNCANDCSMRAYATLQPLKGTNPGNACSCTYSTAQRVSLWFK